MTGRRGGAAAGRGPVPVADRAGGPRSSVHGPSAAWWSFGPAADEMLHGGVHDATLDAELDLLLGAGVYRSTFQTKEYTHRVFGEYFNILEYVERAIGNNQDLVVLQRPAR